MVAYISRENLPGRGISWCESPGWDILSALQEELGIKMAEVEGVRGGER